MKAGKGIEFEYPSEASINAALIGSLVIGISSKRASLPSFGFFEFSFFERSVSSVAWARRPDLIIQVRQTHLQRYRECLEVAGLGRDYIERRCRWLEAYEMITITPGV
jgi:hypothetical protein